MRWCSMMHLNPFLSSIAVPAAAKTVQTVVQVAQEAGQSFLNALSNLRENTIETAAEPTSVAGQVQLLASNFRAWLEQQGIASPFEMQFSLAKNGDPVANVVGPESEKIVDLLYSNDMWLERFSELALRGSEEASATPYGQPAMSSFQPVKLAINSQEAYVLREPTSAFR